MLKVLNVDSYSVLKCIAWRNVQELKILGGVSCVKLTQDLRRIVAKSCTLDVDQYQELCHPLLTYGFVQVTRVVASVYHCVVLLSKLD